MLKIVAAWWLAHDDGVGQQVRQGDMIINIGRRDDGTQRHAASVNQQVIFHAGFSAICWIGAVVFFPPTASAQRCRRRFAIAT